MVYLDMVVSGEGIEETWIIIRTFNGKLCPSICKILNRNVSELNPKFHIL
jgi:hypothetical protein